MSIQTKRLAALACAAMFMLAPGLSAGAAQEPKPEPKPEQQPQQKQMMAKAPADMSAQCKAMMAGHEGMEHMMAHTQAGKESMAMCPMMKMHKMGGMKH